MTAKELAEKLNGRQYLDELTPEIEAEARENNMVIVFGGSDDQMKLRGAIHDEVECYNGGAALIDESGLIRNRCNDSECPNFQKCLNGQIYYTIEAVWGSCGYSWVYETTIPHATFDIMEDGEKYCRGIVFSLNGLGDNLEGKDIQSKSYRCRVVKDEGGKVVILKGKKYPHQHGGRYKFADELAVALAYLESCYFMNINPGKDTGDLVEFVKIARERLGKIAGLVEGDK